MWQTSEPAKVVEVNRSVFYTARKLSGHLTACINMLLVLLGLLHMLICVLTLLKAVGLLYSISLAVTLGHLLRNST